jgi:hypothetical protein
MDEDLEAFDWEARGCLRYRESLDRQLPATRRTQDEFEDER